MSELKAYSGHEIREDIDYNTRGIDPEDKEWCNYGKELCDTLYYRKQEADKVIAEQNERYFELQDTAIGLDKELTETRKQLRHHKYKRCLAMAKRCEAEAHKCLTQQCALVSFQDTDRFQYLQRNFMHFSRWHKRWLELA